MSTFLDETTNLLSRTPIVLRSLLEELPASWGATADTEGGWRPRDVVGHLISAELDDWIPRTRRILEDGTSKPFDKFDRHAHVGRDDHKSLDELLDEFGSLRAASLRQLAELVGDADLDRKGYHPALGEASLRELIATWSVHDLDHTAQIFAGMAGSRDAAVGPWKTYLGILLRREDPAAIPG